MLPNSPSLLLGSNLPIDDFCNNKSVATKHLKKGLICNKPVIFWLVLAVRLAK